MDEHLLVCKVITEYLEQQPYIRKTSKVRFNYAPTLSEATFSIENRKTRAVAQIRYDFTNNCFRTYGKLTLEDPMTWPTLDAIVKNRQKTWLTDAQSRWISQLEYPM